jgi:lysozyme family protein
MNSNFNACLAKLLTHEGGYTADVRDPGNKLPDGRAGSTNLGVTQAVWEAFVGQPVSQADMKALAPAEVGRLYKARYWDAVQGDELPSGVDYSVFDAAVNSGPRQAAKWLQRAVSAPDDGAIGPKTLALVLSYPADDVIERFNQQRLAFLQGLPTFGTFGKGWSRRVAEVESVSTAMLA